MAVRRGRSRLPAALEIVHELDRPTLPGTPARLKELLDSGRIIGLGEWLSGLAV